MIPSEKDRIRVLEKSALTTGQMIFFLAAAIEEQQRHGQISPSILDMVKKIKKINEHAF